MPPAGKRSARGGAVRRAGTRRAPEPLERSSELEAIDGALDAARSGRGGTVLIEGPLGIGKTELLRALLERARGQAGTLVATARGTEQERHFAFGAALRLLGPAVAARRVADPDAFAGASALALPLFDEGRVQIEEDGIFPLLHGLHWLCVTLAEPAPLVLAVDDLQWADAPSQRFVAYLAERVAELPVLLVACRRTGEPDDVGVTDALAETSVTTVLSPAPLSRTAVEHLALDRLGGPEGGGAASADEIEATAARVWERSGGRPLFATELLRDRGTLAERDAALGRGSITPEAIVSVVRRRVDALSPGAQAVARAIAVLGDAATVAEIAALLDRPQNGVLAEIDELAAAELLDPDDALQFAHPVLRDAVLDAIPRGQRTVLDAGAARLLASDHPTRTAAHLVAASALAPIREPWVVPVLLRAADDARSRGGAAEAIRYLRRALDERPEPAAEREIRDRLGVLLDHARDPEGVDQLAAALALADEPVAAAHIAQRAADALFHLARLREASAVCRDAIAALGADDPATRELRLELEARALNADALVGERRERPEQLVSEVAAAATAGERAVLVHVAADRAGAGSAPAGEVAALGRRAVGDGRLLADVGPPSALFVYAGTALAWAGDYGAARSLADAGIAVARERGSLVGLAYATSLRAGVAVYTGDVPQAEADAAQVLDELAEADPMCFAVTLGWAIEVAIERGDVSAVRERLDASWLAGPLPDLGTIDLLLLARGSLAHVEGRLDEALADLEEVGRRAVRARYDNPAAMPWRSRTALVQADRGDAVAALELVEEELRRARSFGAPRAIGVALRVRGSLRAGADGLADLREAVAVLAASEARLEHARTLLELGARAVEEPVARRRELLRQAMDLAHRCGSRVLVDRALELLRETGARPRRPRVHGVDALTPQERRVTRLAADGCDNRAIAEAMFLTRRTVETHLTNAYRKLGIRTRGELTPELLDG